VSLGRLCVLLLIVAAVGLGACGRRGSLEPAPTAHADPTPGSSLPDEPEQDSRFILDWLIE